MTIQASPDEHASDAALRKIEAAVARANLMAVIDSSGRGGNLFFLTLFDQHPEVACCPVVQYTYSYVMAEFGDAKTIDAAVAHHFVTEKSYFRLIYNDPVGANGVLLTRMGGAADAPLDRVRLRRLVDDYFNGRREVTRQEMVLAPLIACALARGMDVDRVKYVLVGDAISLRWEQVRDGFSGRIVDRMLEDFPYAKLIWLIRDPRATFASPRHQYVNTLGNMYALEPGRYFSRLWTLMTLDLTPDNGCVYLFWLMYLRQTDVAVRRKADAHERQFTRVKNEDLNLEFPATMKRISSSLDVEHLQEWLTSAFVPTVCGRPWAGSGAYNSNYQRATTGLLENDPDEVSRRVTGPNEYVTRRWRTRLSRREIELIEHLFRRDIEEQGYEILHDPPDRSDFGCLVRTTLAPFEGELPTWEWLKAGTRAGWREALNRYFYAVSFPPFYVLSRIMLFDVVLRRKLFRR